MTTEYQKKVEESLAFIRARVSVPRELGIILGSGLGDFADGLAGSMSLGSAAIPNYPSQSVEGHRGRLVFAEVGGLPIVAFQGRVHFYEVGDIGKVLYPIHVAHALGVKTLLVTNAAGGIHSQISPGDLMLITDQIDFTLERLPLPVAPALARPLSVYDAALTAKALSVAGRLGIPVERGIYAGVKGPSYETAAEVEMLGKLGADAVGMSTVLETAFASLMGMKVVGISCITNLATGRSHAKLSHQEVTEVGLKVRDRFSKLLLALIKSLSEN
jgi:purine-nucleoside phosphorylase